MEVFLHDFSLFDDICFTDELLPVLFCVWTFTCFVLYVEILSIEHLFVIMDCLTIAYLYLQARVLERTPSLSDLNELVYGQVCQTNFNLGCYVLILYLVI